MANTELNNKYFVRRSSSESWEDLPAKFSGLKVLSIGGFDEEGEAVNVFTQQWTDSQTEDVAVTTQDGQGNDVIIRKNVDLQMTVIVSRRYAQDVYTAVQSPTENPHEQGYYETYNGAYRLTWDTMVVSGKTYYTVTPASSVDEQTVYNSLKAYINGGAFYIKSAYANMYVKVICLSGFKPTATKLHRGEKSYILATIPLHCVEAPVSY